jgi:hypothetical protein
MATLSLHTSVFLSKAEALSVLEDRLGLTWNIDDPSDVTLALEQNAWLTIEVPKFGEDLPLTLDCHHEDAGILESVVEELALRLKGELGWDTHLT